MSEVTIALRDISRRFGETVALENVSLDIRSGEILCLLGENGAGKTTLMRIAAGADTPSSGSIAIDGRVESALSPEMGVRFGIALVHQHFLLVPAMTVAENLALAEISTPFIVSRTVTENAARLAQEQSGLSLGDTRRRVESLSVGEMSRVELVKALRRNPRVLILDEPTSVLSAPEVEELGRALRRLSALGTAIVLITHKLSEVFAFADRVAVLRGGRLVHDSARGAMTARELARIMTGGREIAAPSRRLAAPGPAQLELRSVRTRDEKIRGADLAVAAGEIVAIAGVAGNGQRELALLLRGLIPFEGEVRLGGSRVDGRALAASENLAHVPEDRTNDGFFSDLSVEENIAAGNLAEAPFVSIRRWQREAAETSIREYAIRARAPQQTVGTLSGGNQQKVILARELAHHPRLIVAAEPTRGLDLEASSFVHTKLQQAAESGAAVLVLTSDLDEAFALADAIHVIYRGELSDRMIPPYSADAIGERMAGLR